MKVAAGAASCLVRGAGFEEEETLLLLLGLLRRRRRRGEGEAWRREPGGGASRRAGEASRRWRGRAGEASRRGRECAGEASRRGRGATGREPSGMAWRLLSPSAARSSRTRRASSGFSGGSSASPRRYDWARANASSSLARGPLAVISFSPRVCLRPLHAMETPVRCHTTSAAAWFQVRTMSAGKGVGAAFPFMPRGWRGGGASSGSRRGGASADWRGGASADGAEPPCPWGDRTAQTSLSRNCYEEI